MISVILICSSILHMVAMLQGKELKSIAMGKAHGDFFQLRNTHWMLACDQAWLDKPMARQQR